MESPQHLWIAAVAHYLQRRWRTVEPDVLEDLAEDLSRHERLRAMTPADAAALWLEPVGSPNSPQQRNEVHETQPAFSQSSA